MDEPMSPHVAFLERYLRAIETFAPPDVVRGFFAPDVLQEEFPNKLFASGRRHDLAAMLAASEKGATLLSSQRYVLKKSVSEGDDVAAEIEWTAWNNQVVPELERMRGEFLPGDVTYVDANQRVAEADRATTRVVYTGLFSPRADLMARSKAQLITWVLGAHEYLLQCIEAWAAQIVVRYGLDEMFDIQYQLWGDVVLPGVKKLKEEYLGITGNTVADWMKDLQMDATAMPGKAFDVSFEMSEPDVGIMTFNRCVAADQWEQMGRPDILEKNCHSTCPKSMIVTTQMYNPNMKVDILAIPPRVDPDDVCCKWRFSMRDESDPEYVPIELSKKPQG